MFKTNAFVKINKRFTCYDYLAETNFSFEENDIIFIVSVVDNYVTTTVHFIHNDFRKRKIILMNDINAWLSFTEII